jgi:serine/threonine protein kinase
MLGKGSFGIVYRAQYQGQEVAIKLLKGAAPENRLASEALRLTSLRHEFVVDRLGVCSDPDGRDANGAAVGLAVVMQRATHGSVLDLMRDPAKKQMLSTRKQWLLFMSQAASGVAYLHSQEILHRDIKAGNVLVTGQLRPLIADFGLACMAGDRVACVQGTCSYMAPELLDYGAASRESDMYAFAGVMWFVGSAAEDEGHCSEPWEGMLSDDVTNLVSLGKRPKWPNMVEMLVSLERFRLVRIPRSAPSLSPSRPSLTAPSPPSWSSESSAPFRVP